MDGEDLPAGADFFLRDIPNVKIAKNVPAPSKPSHTKEQLQILNISDESQQHIMETLRHIHGDEFSLADISSYADKGFNFNRKYWMERGNLVIKGIVDFSKIKNEPEDEGERFNMFAVMRLESYYFHSNHCIEALEYCNGEIEEALELLYKKYFNIKPKENQCKHEFSDKELLEQRVDEKSVLESMYDKAFVEKIKHSVWIITLKLEYLINLLLPKKKIVNKSHESKHNKKKKDMCRGFLKGNCKYGANCRFSHEVENKKKDENSHLDNYTFELEIRFPKNSIYPFEPPVIFLKTNAPLQDQICLHICKRLYKEAENLAEDGFPCVYSLLDLLQNEEEITSYIKENKVNFLLPNEKLFPVQKILKHDGLRPSHYKKGMTNKDSKQVLTLEVMKKDNENIIRKFKSKMNNGKYQTMLNIRKSLPAYDLKDVIVQEIKSNQVVVISGETGCGKSTQVPQFILDDWIQNYNNENLNIICTQPRRISAIGVAERVADERIENVGNTIGYQIRLENKISSSTRLTFCTTGILLRRLESDPTLNTVSHIIIDEVHERSNESDFLLVIIRKLLKIRKDLRIILMSATLNAELFSNYFGDVPILVIPGRTFPVQQYFLEDILHECGYILEENSQYSRFSFREDKFSNELENLTGISEKPKDKIKDEDLSFMQLFGRYSDCSKMVLKNLYLLDYEAINLELIESVLLWIVSGEHDYPKTGSILIFLPGISEITALYDQLNYHPEFGQRSRKFLILPLHSTLSSEEQSAIFKPSKDGVRKIILSTNIAETSITIDDCVFVIDTGKMKEKRFDSNRNMESLETVSVTKANALQRKGRAGRVMSGVCIHLFTSHRFKYHLLAQPIPEMHRIALEQLVLHIKVLPNFSDQTTHEVLGNTLEPPLKENIDTALMRLQNVGALDKEQNLTPLGIHLAALPVDVRIGKLMLYGSIFSCVDEALTIAACLSYKSPFVTPFRQKEAANEKKKKFSVGFSDHITVLQAYKKWLQERKTSHMASVNFANENYLSQKTLLALADIKHQLLELLVDIGFVSADLKRRYNTGQDHVLALTGSEFNKNSDKPRLLSAILCAALYPNIVKILAPEKSFLISAAGAIPKVPEAKDLKFRTKQEQVFLHPSSINYTVRLYPSSYLVYQEKVKTSKVFIRDCTMIHPIPLTLFSGSDLEINVHNGTTYISLESGWIVFQVLDHKVAEMIKMMRIELQNLLEEKIKDPLLNLMHHNKGEMIIETFLNLVMD